MFLVNYLTFEVLVGCFWQNYAKSCALTSSL